VPEVRPEDIPTYVKLEELMATCDEDIRAVLGEHRELFRDELPIGVPPPRTIAAHLRPKCAGTALPRRHQRMKWSTEAATFIERTCDKLKAAGMIRQQVHVPFTSAPFLVDKEGAKTRMVVDFRVANEFLENPPMHLPDTRSVLELLQGAEAYGAIDMRSAFWQIPIATGHEYTAFATPAGRIFTWEVVPFGLNVAPAICQATTTEALGDMLLDGAVVYMDDVLIWGKTRAEFVENLRKVFARLQPCTLIRVTRKVPAGCAEAAVAWPHCGPGGD